MIHVEPKDIPLQQVHKFLLGGVAPRPIALVSTISEGGIPNLSPFSFFNAFGYNPPVVAFSPSRKGRNAALKDTYNNLMKTKECVIQAVTYAIVEQISLASTEYPPEVNEFEKSGLTPVASDIVKPFRVKESPFQMECKLLNMISVGDGGGSANIAICEVLKFHVAEDIMRDGTIEPGLIDLVGRMPANYYVRASGNAVFEVQKPGLKLGIGYDKIPDFIKESHVYSANNLGKLGSVEKMPDEKEMLSFIKEIEDLQLEGFESTEESFYRYQSQADYMKMLKTAYVLFQNGHSKVKTFIELSVKCALDSNDIFFAWRAALSVILLKQVKDRE
jgi:flavin reductase (DIM6/NTAB) family NADH-FMN oxidoreductase RutF